MNLKKDFENLTLKACKYRIEDFLLQHDYLHGYALECVLKKIQEKQSKSALLSYLDKLFNALGF